MPAFIIKDGRHYVSIETGESRVLLGIKLTHEPADPVLIRRSARHPGPFDALDEDEIRATVQEALANLREAGAEIHAAEIVYVEDDSPNYGLFKYAAHLVARRYLEGDEFDVGGWRRPPE